MIRILALLLTIAAAPAAAHPVRVFFSQNAQCDTADAVRLRTAARTAQTWLCMRTPIGACGMTYGIDSAPASGAVQMTAMSTPLLVDWTHPLTLPVTLGPDAPRDFGFTTLNNTMLPPAPTRVIAAYTFTLVGGVADVSYYVTLRAELSSVSLNTSGTCNTITDYVDVPLDGSLPALTSAGLSK